ncbi:MAG: HDIG domain-containing protein [Acidobacteriia bacterium]|nr:HDIG domain-containing protein [Terriglobia bacterium]
MALVAILSARISLTPLPQYKVGDIAKEDWVTSDTLVVVDQDLTRLQQQKVMAESPAVLDYDPSIDQASVAVLNGFFGRLNESNIDSDTPASQKIITAAFTNTFHRPASRSLIEALTHRNIRDSLQSNAASLLSQAQRVGIINGMEGLETTANPPRMVLRNIDTNAEQPLPPNTSIPTVTVARDKIQHGILALRDLAPQAKEEFGSAVSSLAAVNCLYNARETQERRKALLAQIQPVTTLIPPGTSLLRIGQPVTPGTVAALGTLQAQESRRKRPAYFIGLLLAVSILAFFIWRFLLQRNITAVSLRKQFVLMMATLAGSLALMRLLFFTFEVIRENFSTPPLNDPLSSKFAIPFAAGAMLVTLLLDAQLGMVFAILFALFTGYLSQSSTLAFYALISSWAAIYAARQYQNRNALIKAGLIVGVCNFLLVAGLVLMGERAHDRQLFLFDLGNTIVGGFFVAASVSILLPLFEYAFDICTDIRLLELSNLNLPILRRLAAEAPGTYHHSILVGILAETAAEAIGANGLLARVACLYHDIGKVIKPTYYIENSKEAIQRHDQLAPSMSSSVIMDHVREGLRLAREIHLPRRVSDMIPQHHGTSLVTYFYHKAKSGPDSEEVGISEEQYRYPGPRPQSQEAALIMMADSIEAASRTVQNPTPRKLQKVVERIMERFLNDHQLDEAPLTLHELSLVQNAFTKALSSIYHERIAYPNFDFNQTTATVSSSGA